MIGMICTRFFFFFICFLANQQSIFHNFFLCCPSQRSARGQVPSQVATHQEMGNQLWAGETPDSNPGLQDNSLAHYHWATICTRLAWYWRNTPQSFCNPPLTWESHLYPLDPFLLTWKSLLWRGATPVHSDPWLAVYWPSPPLLLPIPFPLPPTVPHFKYMLSYDDITTSASHSPIKIQLFSKDKFSSPKDIYILRESLPKNRF
jgi:hypothetical protein